MSELAETPPRRIRPALSDTDWPDWNDWRTNPPVPAHRRDSFYSTLHTFTRELDWNPFALGAQFDALHADYYTQLNRALQASAKTALPRLCSVLCEPDTQRVLRNVAAWASFRIIPASKKAATHYRSTAIASGVYLNEETGPPLFGIRLCLLTAVLASAMASEDQGLKALAHHLCQHFIKQSALTGNWAGVFRVLAADAPGTLQNGSAHRFPRLHEARGYLTDSERVRLKLYWQHHQGPLKVLRLIESVAYLPGISWQIKSREIRRFLDARRSIGAPVSPLRLRHIEWLRERELRLLVRRPELLDALLGHNGTASLASNTASNTASTNIKPHVIREHASDLLERYPRAKAHLQRLRRAIDIRNWPVASECIACIRLLNPPRRWIYLQLRFAGCDEKGRLDRVPDMQAESWSVRGWEPMPKSDFQWLATHVSAKVLERMQIGIPPWMSVQEATDALLKRSIASDKVTPLEMQLLFNAMTQAQWQSIDAADRRDLLMDNGPLWLSYDLDKALLLSARSGRGEASVMHRAGHAKSVVPLLRQMAVAQAQGRYVHNATRLLHVILEGRSNMGTDTAQPWYLPYIGLPAWRAIERHFDDVQPALTDALMHAKAKGRIYNPRGYFKRLQQWNTDIGQTFAPRLFETWCQLANLSPAQAFEKLPVHQACLLLADIDTMPGLLASLPVLHHRELQADVLVAKAWRTQDEDALWQLLTQAIWHHRPHRNMRTARVPSHLALTGCGLTAPLPDTTLDLHIAFIRQDPHALKRLHKHTNPAQLEAALWRVARRISATHARDAAFLQMLALLGADIAAQLSALLAQAGLSRHNSHTGAPAFGHSLDTLYETRSIPKRNGKTRTLLIPNPLLKCIQKRIAQRVLAPLGAHRCATGFVKNVSIADNAMPHTHKDVVATCDISNCFPGVPARKVWHALSRDLSRDFSRLSGHVVSPIAIRWLAQICCAHGALPIGAPTSPALLNRVLFDLDDALASRATELGCCYTRYADDLCFSGGEDCLKLIGQASRNLKALGLKLDPEKTNIFRRGRRQMVTGLCVNEGVHIPRSQRKLLRAALHRAAVVEEATAQGQSREGLPKPFLNGKELNHHMLRGHVAWHNFIKRKRHAALQ